MHTLDQFNFNCCCDTLPLYDISSRQNTILIILLDPRGFCVALAQSWLESALFNHHCSIAESGEISGKLAYIWKDHRFSTLLNESSSSIIDIDDNSINEVSSTSKCLKLKDLEVGKVHEAYNRDKVHLDRYVYIGEYMMHELNAAYNYFTSYSVTHHLSNYIVSMSGKCMLPMFPWNDDLCISFTKALEKSFHSYPVFIKLVDMIDWNRGLNAPSTSKYCDSLAEDTSGEHSLKYAYSNSSIVQSRAFVKQIIKESECQDIRILANDLTASRKSCTSAPQHYTSANDYKVLSLSMVVKGFKKFLEAMNAEIRECM